MKISKLKKYRTRSGLPVRIYATDGSDECNNETYVVHGAVKEDCFGWVSNTWKEDGHFSWRTDNEYDLIEVKPRKPSRKKKKEKSR